MRQIQRVRLRLVLALGFLCGLSDVAASHSGIVDGYGCHRGSDKVSYHCHQGQFAGKTFKSKDDFLHQLRGGKSPQLSPRNNPAPPQKKKDDQPDFSQFNSAGICDRSGTGVTTEGVWTEAQASRSWLY